MARKRNTQQNTEEAVEEVNTENTENVLEEAPKEINLETTEDSEEILDSEEPKDDNSENNMETKTEPKKEIVELSEKDDDTTKSILNEERIVIDLIKQATEGDNNSLKNLAKIIVDYNNDMKLAKFDNQTVSRQYSFYYTLKGILNKTDDDLVKHLNLICYGFETFKNEGFKQIKLFRFDEEWKWGIDSLDTCNLLMMVLSTLANVETRKEQLKIVDFNRVHELKDITPDQASALEGYFKN